MFPTGIAIGALYHKL